MSFFLPGSTYPKWINLPQGMAQLAPLVGQVEPLCQFFSTTHYTNLGASCNIDIRMEYAQHPKVCIGMQAIAFLLKTRRQGCPK